VKVLKRLAAHVDPSVVKTCEGCGLPAPLSTDHCALCTRPFPPGTPTAYRLAVSGESYRWTAAGETRATAVWRDGTWDITNTATNRVDSTLIAVETDGIRRVAVVDHRARTAVTYTPAGEEQVAGLGIVRDSFNEPLLLVRGDGPTGLHVVDGSGAVLAIASQVDDSVTGLDLLITGAGAVHTRMLLGVSLALELLRAGGLRRVA
jgi:hypothetical protein